MSRKTICLTMIVKDEAHLIVETLTMLLKYITFDYWVISDTGSTDGTQDLIRAFFAERGIAGELNETPWRDFGYNRTIAFERAYKKTDYAFVWDADDEIAGNFKMPENLTHDSYHFIFGNASGFRYNRLQLFNNRLRWKYVGVLHEYPACCEKTGPFGMVKGDYYFISGRRGARSKDPKKYEKDALILEKSFEESVAAGSPNTRDCYYCAQSWHSCGQIEKATEWYKKVLTLPGWAEEKYVACKKLYEISEGKGKPEEGLQYLVESHHHVSDRIECIYQLVKYYCVKGMPRLSYIYYTMIQDYYENRFLTDTNLSRHLFVSRLDYDFYLPYYMIIVANRIGMKDLCVKMFSILFKARALEIGEWWIHNLFHNLQLCIDAIPIQTNTFLEDLLSYKDALYRKGITFKPEENATVERIIRKFEPLLSSPPTTIPSCKSVNGAPRVILTMTTCKRLDLFRKTVNSVVRTWTDLDRVDAWLCVDDNSSEEDRAVMKATYPFVEFYMKSPAERGHRASMNLIWNRLKEMKATYWIHLEDDWLFFKSEEYVGRSIDFLERHRDQGIHQILFNRNYAELYASHGWSIVGGKVLEPDYLLHVKDMPCTGPNSAYWPHYSFRPSMTRVETVLALGNYDSPNTFFERDYANRWWAAGHISAFFNTITCLHTGKLTSDKSGTNAYALNEIKQFGGPAAPAPAATTYVVNLKRRPDRRKAMETLLDSVGIKGYTFYEAVDGQILTPTAELARLFHGNDFGTRRGFVGCALSHMNLWKQLLSSKSDYYTIFEDDIEYTSDFKEKYATLGSCVKGRGSLDLLYLGYSSRGNMARANSIQGGIVAPLDRNKCIGGTFGYCITKSGARKLLSYIEVNGIKHGIDYLMKIVPGIEAYSFQPHIVLSDWVVSKESPVDSDIQKDYTPLILTATPHPDLWTFYPGVDSSDGDIRSVGRKPINELMLTAELTAGCVAFNTLGFLKRTVRWPLKSTPWLRGGDGLYVRKPLKAPTRVKILCNWCSSEQLCKEWEHMSQGGGAWNNLQITSEDKDIDYYVIINRPPPGATYIPEKTVVFQMEPWCGDSYQTWGVKTWGEWAKPDPKKFLQVRSHDAFYNNAFWQLSSSYTALRSTHPEKTKGETISSICSSKYFDPGHKYRIDFLKFLEAKGDIDLHIYNADNKHGFKSYSGPVTAHKDKDKGIAPYKYYFMCENNVERNFVTEKLWEPILTETLCFYWGCPNVADILDKRAYVQLDMADFEGSYQIVKQAIAENWWEKRLPFLRAEKQKILEYYQFFPTLERIISEDTASKAKSPTIT